MGKSWLLLEFFFQITTNVDALARGLIKAEDLLAGTSISCEICNALSEEWVKFYKKNYVHTRPFKEWQCGGSLWSELWACGNEEMRRFVGFF